MTAATNNDTLRTARAISNNHSTEVLAVACLAQLTRSVLAGFARYNDASADTLLQLQDEAIAALIERKGLDAAAVNRAVAELQAC